MSEKILKALMQLFAIVGNIEKDGIHGRKTVEFFLRQQLNKELVEAYLKVYDDYYNSLTTSDEEVKKRKQTSVSAVKVIIICGQINEALNQKQRLLVLIRLIEFVKSNNHIGEAETEFISTVSSEFKIPDEEYDLLLEFILNDNPFGSFNSPDLLIINNRPENTAESLNHIYAEGISTQINILRIKSVGTYLLKHFESSELYLNGQFAADKRIHILTQGSAIRSSKLHPIYYSDILSRFMSDDVKQKITFESSQIEYVFKNGKKGLREISFAENSGTLIGIMGGSGAGKSTLLNVLNGNDIPSSGKVLINGIDLHRQNDELEGVVGFISQDDLLIEELTVYQNLFYNTKLCFADYSNEKIDELVNNLLISLGLEETKNLQVGSPLQKTISGGQRKRLNIALELIREPSVLFVDEPTSGLSSRDSENIMDLLKEQSLLGKLVFVVIHQPSSDIFKMFDRLLILDIGGYPIYYGNAVESLIYFKTAVNYINAQDAECGTCGNVNPEQVFNIIETKILNESGSPTHTRKISPKEWNEEFRKNYLPKKNIGIGTEKIESHFKKPGFFSQVKVFLQRDMLSKLSNTQYLVINFFEAPVLAFILALLTKYYRNGNEYIFSENKNLTAYIFMCVVVALFIGLTVSAEEIIKDRKILKREKFLNLSRASYLLSKIALLFAISAIQTICLVLVGNFILEIRGMYLEYWLVLFSTACFANMLGLNISSAFDSNVTIYILIPFLLIPQLLLSGVIVKFDELHPGLSRKSVVPLTGDLMASRWAFEALAVSQYMNNDYEKKLYPFEKSLADATFKKTGWYDKMEEVISESREKINAGKKDAALKENILLLSNEIRLEEQHSGLKFNRLNELKEADAGEIPVTLLDAADVYLREVKDHYGNQYNSVNKKYDHYKLKFQETPGGIAQFNFLREKNHNKKIEDLVKDENPMLEPTIIDDGHIYSNRAPILRDATKGRFIRAHLYAPYKYLFGKIIPTFWLNIIIIWCMAIVLIITLYYNTLRKFIRYFSAMAALMKHLNNSRRKKML